MALQALKGFASDVAFEATDYLPLAQSPSGAAVQVCLGAAIVAKPDRNDAMKSRIGLAVASPVEPVPVGLAGGGRYGAHSA